MAPLYRRYEAYLDSFEQGMLGALTGDISGQRLLDVGGGTGRTAVKFAATAREVVVLDHSPAMLKVAQGRSARLTTVVGEAENIPFPDASFDVVTALFLIVHLKRLDYFFDEVRRVLVPNGRFIVSAINQKDPPEIKTAQGIVKIESYYHRPEAVAEALEESLFTILRRERITENGQWIAELFAAQINK